MKKLCLIPLCIAITVFAACGSVAKERIPVTETEIIESEITEEQPVSENTQETEESSEMTSDLDEYVGQYSGLYQNDFDCVITIDKKTNEDGKEVYVLTGGVYRAVVFSESEIVLSPDGVSCDIKDQADNVWKLTLFKNDDDTYSLRIDESPDTRDLPTGTIIEGLEKRTQDYDFYGESDLVDNTYYACLAQSSQSESEKTYVQNIQFDDDKVVVDGVLAFWNAYEGTEYYASFQKNTFCVNSDTQYLISDESVTSEEFENRCKTDPDCYMLYIDVNNGWATELKALPKDSPGIRGQLYLQDGEYYTSLFSEPGAYEPFYISNISFSDDKMIVTGTLCLFNNYGVDFDNTYSGSFIININEDTRFVAGGGEAEPQQMSLAEFEEHFNNCMNSGLGFIIKIENGYATEIGIWS